MAASVFFIYGFYSNIISVWPYLVFNFTLIIFILIFIAPQNWLQNKYLLKVSEQTLGIYLLHPLVQKIIFIIIGDKEQTHINIKEGVGIFILVTTFTLGLIWSLRRWNVTDQYLLGNIKR